MAAPHLRTNNFKYTLSQVRAGAREEGAGCAPGAVLTLPRRHGPLAPAPAAPLPPPLQSIGLTELSRFALHSALPALRTELLRLHDAKKAARRSRRP